MRRATLAALAAICLWTLSACGGSGSNPPPPPIVTISPATANVQEGAQQQFIGTVTNTTDTGLTWQVNGITGGNSTVGTIDSSGLYTAPAAIPNPASVTINAVITDNTSISGSAIATITAVTFNNSSLKGNYVFSLSGVDENFNSFYALGALTFDGNGKITAGEEDIVDVTSGYVGASGVSNASYNVGPDGRGTLTFQNTIGIFQFAFAMQALDNAVINETDNNVVAATGTLEVQSTSISAPSGIYAFGFGGSGLGCGSVRSAGLFAMNGTTIGGTQDVNCGGNIIRSQTVSGSYGSTDALGRGIGSFSGSSTGSSNMIYYAVSPNRFRFLADPNAATFFLGSADKQTQAAFAASDFNGSYVITSSANTASGVSYTLIYINANAGNVSTGYYDVNDTGSTGQASLTGSYSLNANGYVNGTWNVNNVALPFGLYLFSPTQGYYVDERTSLTGGGNIYGQTGSVTTNADWAGSYATRQFGYFLSNGVLNPGNASGVTGQISADGNTALAGTLDFNNPAGVTTGATLISPSNYGVTNTAPGRFTAKMTTQVDGTRNYVGYIIDEGRVLLMETDSNLVSSGDAIRQF